MLIQKSVTFVGHVVSEHGIATDPKKTKAVAEWPVSKTIPEVLAFLDWVDIIDPLYRSLHLLPVHLMS